MDSEVSLPHQSTKQQLSLSMMRISCAYVLKHTDVPPGALPNPKFCTEKSLPPLAGDGAPMKKMLAFFHGYPGRWPKAGRGDKKPGFIPPAAARRVKTAWRRAQHLRRLAGRITTPLIPPTAARRARTAWRRARVCAGAGGAGSSPHSGQNFPPPALPTCRVPGRR